jgi:hypothetical protein
VSDITALATLTRDALLLNVICMMMIVVIVIIVLRWKWHGCDRGDGRRSDIVIVVELSVTLAVIW